MTWQSRTAPIQVGDRVAYARRFLQSISCYTGDIPQGRGTVIALQQIGQTSLGVLTGAGLLAWGYALWRDPADTGGTT